MSAYFLLWCAAPFAGLGFSARAYFFVRSSRAFYFGAELLCWIRLFFCASVISSSKNLESTLKKRESHFSNAVGTMEEKTYKVSEAIDHTTFDIQLFIAAFPGGLLIGDVAHEAGDLVFIDPIVVPYRYMDKLFCILEALLKSFSSETMEKASFKTTNQIIYSEVRNK